MRLGYEMGSFKLNITRQIFLCLLMLINKKTKIVMLLNKQKENCRGGK